MSEELSRISLTIPKDLLSELDDVLKEQNYSSRSEAVRDSLRDFLSDYRWRKKLKGEQRGVVVMLYDHDVRGLSDELIDIQHDYMEAIVSVQHLHVSESDCLEAIVVDGSGEVIRGLVESLRALRGVRQVKLAMIGG